MKTESITVYQHSYMRTSEKSNRKKVMVVYKYQVDTRYRYQVPNHRLTKNIDLL